MHAYMIALGISVLLYFIMVSGLSLQYGFTGLNNFGQVGFVAVGAYTSALLSIHGAPLTLSVAAGTVLAALTAYPIGIISLRLQGDYLAIVTLGFSEAVRQILQSEDWLTKGIRGLPGIPRMFRGLVMPAHTDLAVLVLLVAVALCVLVVIRLIIRSPFGRVIEAIRDNEVAVAALGKNAAQFKTRTFMIGAGIAGLAGALQAHYLTFISPDQYIPLITIYVWVALILGGSTSLLGGFLGSVLLVGFLEGSRFIPSLFSSVTDVQAASVRIGVIGLALILAILYRPNGLLVPTKKVS